MRSVDARAWCNNKCMTSVKASSSQTQAIVDLNIFKGEKFIRIKYVYKLKGNGNKNFYRLI